jgi:hypothetical protein
MISMVAGRHFRGCGLDMMSPAVAMRQEEARAEAQRRKERKEHGSRFPAGFSSLSVLLCAFASLREISLRRLRDMAPYDEHCAEAAPISGVRNHGPRSRVRQAARLCRRTWTHILLGSCNGPFAADDPDGRRHPPSKMVQRLTQPPGTCIGVSAAPTRAWCSRADALRPFVVVIVAMPIFDYDNDNRAKRYRNLSVGALVAFPHTPNGSQHRPT